MILKSTSLSRSLSAAMVIAASVVTLVGQAKPPVSPEKPPQTPASGAKPGTPLPGAKPPVQADAVTPPPGYLIGPEDVLTINFYKEEIKSSDVTVRPDGMITLQLINDIQAAGLTPDQLRLNIVKAATQFIVEPTVTVIPKQINSRKVYITGSIAKGGPYPLTPGMRVAQLLAIAGGPADWADTKNIMIIRTGENGKQTQFKFNWEEMKKGKKIEQNIELRPNDTVIVP